MSVKRGLCLFFCVYPVFRDNRFVEDILPPLLSLLHVKHVSKHILSDIN